MRITFGRYAFYIDVNDNEHTVLQIENPVVFREIVSELNSQIDGKSGTITVFDDDKGLDIRKNVEIIMDYFNLDFEKKSFITKVYDEMKNYVMSGNMFQEYINLIDSMNIFVSTLENTLDIELLHDSDPDLSSFLKFLKLRIEHEYDEFADQIVAYLKLLTELAKIRLVVLVDIKKYLAEEEIKWIYKNAEYQGICLLLIEGGVSVILENEKRYIIDKDVCLI